MSSSLSIRFITFGADVPASSSAGVDEALTMRCMAFIGTENIEPACHSKTCFFVSPSCQTSVDPRPSTTRNCSSYMCCSALSAPLPGTSTT